MSIMYLFKFKKIINCCFVQFPSDKRGSSFSITHTGMFQVENTIQRS